MRHANEQASPCSLSVGARYLTTHIVMVHGGMGYAVDYHVERFDLVCSTNEGSHAVWQIPPGVFCPETCTGFAGDDLELCWTEGAWL